MKKRDIRSQNRNVFQQLFAKCSLKIVIVNNNKMQCIVGRPSFLLWPYAKMIYVFGFLSICQSASLPERQFARAPVSPERQFCQSASFARVLVSPERQSVLPERQFASFARAPVSPERQLAKVLVSFARAPVCQSASFARAPVLPERQFCQFCQSASFARAPVLPECQFCQSASFARAPVLPERQFCQSASFASFASLLKC